MTNTDLNIIFARIKNAKVRANEIINSPSSTEEEREDAQSLLYEVTGLVHSMCEYTQSVFDDERKKIYRTELIRNANSVKDFQENAEKLEIARGIKHDGLLLSVKMTDMYCRLHGIEEICGLLPEEYKNDVGGLLKDPATGVLRDRHNPAVPVLRHKIANWCWEVVLASTVEMYIEHDGYECSVSQISDISEVYNKKIGGTKGAEKMIHMLTDIGR